MSVILKQRTCRAVDGRAVPEGDPDSAFLVGPKGGKVSDETAIALGLVDGWIAGTEPKGGRPEGDKRDKSPKADKSGRRKAAQGTPLPEKKTKGEQLVVIIGGMIREVSEAGNRGGQVAADAVMVKLFTKDKLPDSRVLAARLEDNVSASERDEAWLEFQIANPDIDFSDPDAEESGEGEGSDASKSPEDGKESGDDDTGAGEAGNDDII